MTIFFTVVAISGCGSTAADFREEPTKVDATNRNFHVAWSVAMSPDGNSVAAGYGGIGNELFDQPDDIVRLWDLKHPETLPIVLSGHKGAINSIDFSSEGEYLASGSSDGTIRVWDLRQHSPTAIHLKTSSSVQSVAFSPNGHTLAAGGGEGQAVYLWDIRRPQDRPLLLSGDQYTGQSLAFTLDGSKLAAAEQTGVRIWDMSDLNNSPAILRSEIGIVWAVAFSPNGQILAEGGVGQTVNIWDVQKPISPTLITTLRGHEGTIRSLSFSPDGHTLASASNDTTIRLWSIQQPEVTTVLRGHNAVVQSIAFSPDGQTLASVGGDGAIRLWDLRQPGTNPHLLNP